MPVAALSSEAVWEAKKKEMRSWLESEWIARMSILAPQPARQAFMTLIELLEENPPAGDEGVVLEALYDTLRSERYLTESSPGRYRVEGEAANLRVRFAPDDVRAYLDERIAWLGERLREGHVIAGHYRDAVRLIRDAIFGRAE